MIDSNEIIKQLEKRLQDFSADSKTQNIGTVEKNSDGVITASGLSQAVMGEIVEFEKGGNGVVFNLDEDSVSIILLDKNVDLKEGDIVKRTERILSVLASEELLGRVVNP